MKFSIKDFFKKCDKIRRKLQIWSHFQRKSLTENLIFVQCDQEKSINFQFFVISTKCCKDIAKKRVLF